MPPDANDSAREPTNDGEKDAASMLLSKTDASDVQATVIPACDAPHL